eukprot:TRINITY_DN24977_c0_g1_i1.p3 TRINITY_DN24977_c0_g1~~TRINITY_DN24977_c0_g1_i1.p3  ORF type:complete len:122 (-),score=32.24 TRINITY_DN24977_c0_g1_i1:604-969(-)
MSAFQVHGVSRHALFESAKKRINAVEWINGHAVGISEEKWLEKVSQAADEAFKTAKPTALSPRYDSPRFAEAYIEKAKQDPLIRDLFVKALTPTGAIDPETKMPVLKWMPYTPATNAKQIA